MDAPGATEPTERARQAQLEQEASVSQSTTESGEEHHRDDRPTPTEDGQGSHNGDEEDDHDGVADPVAPALPQRLLLTATGLASRRYTFEAESWEDALSQFHGLSTEELNAPTWSIWGIDLDVDVSLVVGALVEGGEADEDALEDIAMHLDVQLP